MNEVNLIMNTFHFLKISIPILKTAADSSEGKQKHTKTILMQSF